MSKFGYVDGTIKVPSREDPTYAKWEVDNYLVMSWLTHSMEPDIAETFFEMATAQDIWDTLAETYSRKGNVAQIYELRRLIEAEVQGDRSTLQYFTSLGVLWKRIDHLLTSHLVYPTDSASFKTYIESKRIFKFLASLKPELDPVRSRILSMEPLPTLREAFAFVQLEKEGK